MRIVQLTMYEFFLALYLEDWIVEPFLTCEGVMDG